MVNVTWHEEVRSKNREEIILAAQQLFLEHDFHNVGIKDVCLKAGVSRVTFYKCFNSIHDLAFEVQIKVMSEMMTYIEEHYDDAGTGIQKLEKMLYVWLDFVKQYPNHMKYVGFFDHYYRDRYPNPELTEHYRTFVQQERSGMRLHDLLEQGIADGTIREDLDIRRISAVIFESMISFFQRMASIGSMVEQEHGVEQEEVARAMIDMIIRYVKK
jgi:Transcriptional regulator